MTIGVTDHNLVIRSEVEKSLAVLWPKIFRDLPTSSRWRQMDTITFILLCLGIAVIAFLYSSVGHAGASGYIATMTLFGLATTMIRPTALILNILVATIGSLQFWRAGHFSW